MTSLTITDLDDEMTDRIIQRAEEHGRSIEDEARALLRQALDAARDRPAPPVSCEVEPGDRVFIPIQRQIEPFGDRDLDIQPGDKLASRIRARVAPIGGVELELPPRGRGREPPSFD